MSNVDVIPAVVQVQAGQDALLEELVDIDAQVDAAEEHGIMRRWEFGRLLLEERERNGGKQLPHGRLAEICSVTGRSEREIRYRVTFAEEYPTRDEVCTAVQTFSTWTEIRDEIQAAAKRERLEAKAARVAEIAESDPAPLEAVGTFPVIYVDPPWRYDFAASSTRQIENHYPTMHLDDIKALSVPAADDAVLLMWATSPKLREAFEVLDAWGFTYVTSMVWVKDRIGMGYYARSRHELLLIAKRGALPVPDPEDRPDSVIEAPLGKHSEKPDAVYEIIERMYPLHRKVELFARRARDGWAAWGNQAATA